MHNEILLPEGINHISMQMNKIWQMNIFPLVDIEKLKYFVIILALILGFKGHVAYVLNGQILYLHIY